MTFVGWSIALWVLWFAYWAIASQKVEASQRSEPVLSRGIHLGLMATAFLLLYADLPWRLTAVSAPLIGLSIQMAGLLFSVWARVHLGRYWSGAITIKEGHTLIRSGPYVVVRHPIYTGFILAMVGSVVAVNHLAGLGSVVLVLLAYGRKIKMEETVLTEQFGEAYRHYCSEVRALIPFIW